MHRPISLDLVHAHQQQLRAEARRERFAASARPADRPQASVRVFGLRLGWAR